MSSTMLQKLSEGGAAGAVVDAVEVVAEKSFFAVVDRGPEDVLKVLAESVQVWMVATVRFEGGPVKGSMTCTVPEDLAYTLFDGFSGRDPSEAVPGNRQLYDLLGEFANMVCGSWLSRCAAERAFRLDPPLVAHIGGPHPTAPGRHWLGIATRPVAVDVYLHSAAPGAEMAAGA
jgi:hypothetical protein